MCLILPFAPPASVHEEIYADPQREAVVVAYRCGPRGRSSGEGPAPSPRPAHAVGRASQRQGGQLVIPYWVKEPIYVVSGGVEAWGGGGGARGR